MGVTSKYAKRRVPLYNSYVQAMMATVLAPMQHGDACAIHCAVQPAACAFAAAPPILVHYFDVSWSDGRYIHIQG